MNKKTRSAHGFSLAEIVLALGLCSIAILSIVGLLGVSMKSSRDAGDSTAIASMSQQVLADLSAAPFTALGETAPRATLDPPEILPATLADSIYHFDDQGMLTATEDATVVYQCIVRKSPDATTRGLANGPYNRVRLELYFTWPVSAHANPDKRPGRVRIYSSIARF